MTSRSPSLLPVLLSGVVALTSLCSAAPFSPPSRRAPKTPECSQGLPPPDQPFRVVWNHPDPCEKSGHPLNLSDYGIIHNTGRRFIGDEIQTLYNTGRWPRLSGNRSINGGLPQVHSVCVCVCVCVCVPHLPCHCTLLQLLKNTTTIVVVCCS